MKTLLVNIADWDAPEPVPPDGWVIANAPRRWLGR